VHGTFTSYRKQYSAYSQIGHQQRYLNATRCPRQQCHASAENAGLEHVGPNRRSVIFRSYSFYRPVKFFPPRLITAWKDIRRDFL